MPLLNAGKNRASAAARKIVPGQKTGEGSARRRNLFATCANPACTSAWLHPLRSRSGPIFEDGWTCSAECTRTVIQAAIYREMEGRQAERPMYRHRIPLGLLMLEHKWITHEELRAALGAQQQAGGGRIGNWLVRQGAVKEETVTRALALQWSCPVIACDGHLPEALTAAMPRLFVDAFTALPVRITGTSVLYLAFEDALDPVLALAISRMTGLRVECGVVSESQFRPALTRMLDAAFPPVSLIEAVTPAAAAQTFAREMERTRPVASRLVRVHDYLWLRQQLRPAIAILPERDAVRDLVCSIVPYQA